MARLFTILALTLLAAAALCPVAAHARPATAKENARRAEELNVAAVQAFKEGQFDAAATLFMQVYDLAKTPSAVFNAARAREAAKKLPEARALFELYGKIEKTPAGVADAAAHMAAIAAAVAATLAAEAEGRRRAEEAARAAEEAAKRAEAARLELERREAERQRLEKARLDAENAKAQAEKARNAALRSAPDGLALLPPTGTEDDETERLVRDVQVALQKEAVAARVGRIVGVGEFVQAEQARSQGAPCDLRCRLDVARNLGVAFAVSTTLRREGKEWRLRLVLWQTGDAAELTSLQVGGWTAAGVTLRSQRAAGDLFNTIRVFALEPAPLPPAPTPQSPAASPAPEAGAKPEAPLLTLTTDPAGAQVTFNEVDLGVTPLWLKVPPGRHRVRLQRSGFHARGGALLMPAAPQRLTVPLPVQLPAEATITAATTALAPAQAAVAAPAAGAAPPAAAPAPEPKPALAVAAVPRTGAATPVAPKPEGALPAASQPPSKDPPGANGAAAKEAGSADEKAKRAGFVWGLVAHGEGGAALLNDARDLTTADLGWGAGGFLHMSSAAEGEVPFASWVVGARYQRYLGLWAPADPVPAKPVGVSAWTGLLLPRFSGLCGSLHYNYVTVHSGHPGFGYLTAQARVMSANSVFFYSYGVDFLIKSLRPVSQYDDFGRGPIARLTVEVGVNLGGTPLSR